MKAVNLMRVPFRQVTVEIRSAASGLLVAAIEILSPVNKRAESDEQEAYLRKRDSLLGASVHLLEIDLLRRGERLPVEPPIIDSIYERAGYDLDLNYSVAPWPPLTRTQSVWVTIQAERQSPRHFTHNNGAIVTYRLAPKENAGDFSAEAEQLPGWAEKVLGR